MAGCTILGPIEPRPVRCTKYNLNFEHCPYEFKAVAEKL